MRILGFVLILLVVLAALYYSCERGATQLDSFIDAPSFLIVLGPAAGGFLMSAGPRTGAALRAAFSKSSTGDHLRVGIRAFRSARYGALTGGFFAAVAGLQVVLVNFDSPARIGPGMALGGLGFLTGMFLAYCVLLPLQTGIERRLAESEGREMAPAETAVDLLTMGGGFLLFGIYCTLVVVIF